VHGRRLAGAVGAEEAVDLTGIDVQPEPVDRAPLAAELAHQVLHLDAVRHSRRFGLEVQLLAHLGRLRRGVDDQPTLVVGPHQLDHGIANGDLVAAIEQQGRLDSLTVDERPVRRPEVFDL